MCSATEQKISETSKKNFAISYLAVSEEFFNCKIVSARSECSRIIYFWIEVSENKQELNSKTNKIHFRYIIYPVDSTDNMFIYAAMVKSGSFQVFFRVFGEFKIRDSFSNGRY